MKRVQIFVAALLALVYFGCSKTAQEITPAPTDPVVQPVAISGVNWADARDNFVDGWVIPSGLTAGDDYTAAAAKANAIYSGFLANMKGVNAVRLPVNPPSVTESWWNSYQAVIDQALAKNLKVILACWEGTSKKDGKIDDLAAFWQMWKILTDKYGNQSNVYFEVFNEPYGYTLSELSDVYVQFLIKFPGVPKGRILLGGTGYSEDVTGVGADKRFDGCLLALHNYAFWNTRTQTEWETNWRVRFGAYASRTVVTEFGAAMTTGKNYGGSAASDNEIAYIVGSTNVFRNSQISSVYWPGLRDGDSYSMQIKSGEGANIMLTTSNASGLARLKFGWGN